MNRRFAAIPVLVSSLILASPAVAQAPPIRDDGRFLLRDSPEGLLRMDTRTGAISICARRGTEFTCRLAPDDRAALEAEIDRLKAENEALRRGLGNGRAPTPGFQTPAPGGTPPTAQMPTDQEVDRMLSLAERIWRGIQRMMREDPPPAPPGRL